MNDAETIHTISDDDVEVSLLQDIPLSYAKGNLVLPMKVEDGRLLGAVSGPKGVLALNEISRRMGLSPRPLTAPAGVIIDAINRFYGQMGTAEEVMGNISGEDFSSVATEFEKPRDILELTEDAPIIRLLNALLQQAAKEGASDIHIEPFEKELDVRIRVDGIMRKVLAPPKIIQDALVSRVKIMANLDIAEKRLPQDGKIRLLIGGRDIDVRVSIVPTSHGERAVLRLLDRRRGLIGLEELGLMLDDRTKLDRLLGHSGGIILVTGPTGSGKTTTLYAAINRIYSEQKNIITVEDPVEYQLKGVGQIQVNPKIGLTFAAGLRSILRQDPDVIMVGEIRDLETAQIAVQASLTGHLVLSTLHTNDAPSAITRLVDMGIEPFLVSSSVIGIIAQRLVRNICPSCKSAYTPSESEAAYFSVRPATLSRGTGCAKCGGSGYTGRSGLFEIITVDDKIRSAITSGADAMSIRNTAVINGMRSLSEDGLLKASQGTTTLEEVLRVTQTDTQES